MACISGFTQTPAYSFDCKVLGTPPNNANSSNNSNCRINFSDYINTPEITLHSCQVQK